MICHTDAEMLQWLPRFAVEVWRPFHTWWHGRLQFLQPLPDHTRGTACLLHLLNCVNSHDLLLHLTVKLYWCTALLLSIRSGDETCFSQIVCSQPYAADSHHTGVHSLLQVQSTPRGQWRICKATDKFEPVWGGWVDTGNPALCAAWHSGEMSHIISETHSSSTNMYQSHVINNASLMLLHVAWHPSIIFLTCQWVVWGADSERLARFNVQVHELESMHTTLSWLPCIVQVSTYCFRIAYIDASHRVCRSSAHALTCLKSCTFTPGRTGSHWLLWFGPKSCASTDLASIRAAAPEQHLHWPDSIFEGGCCSASAGMEVQPVPGETTFCPWCHFVNPAHIFWARMWDVHFQSMDWLPLHDWQPTLGEKQNHPQFINLLHSPCTSSVCHCKDSWHYTGILPPHQWFRFWIESFRNPLHEGKPKSSAGGTIDVPNSPKWSGIENKVTTATRNCWQTTDIMWNS